MSPVAMTQPNVASDPICLWCRRASQLPDGYQHDGALVVPHFGITEANI